MDWYNTRNGDYVKTDNNLTTPDGTLRLSVPDIIIGSNTDWAFYIHDSNSSRSKPNKPTKSDSLALIHEQKNSILVTPNPSKGLFQVSLKKLDEPTELISVYNYSGKLVYESQITTTNFNINLLDQPPGVYLVKVLSFSGCLFQKIVNE